MALQRVSKLVLKTLEYSLACLLLLVEAQAERARHKNNVAEIFVGMVLLYMKVLRVKAGLKPPSTMTVCAVGWDCQCLRRYIE